jgi:hypothetical protein
LTASIPSPLPPTEENLGGRQPAALTDGVAEESSVPPIRPCPGGDAVTTIPPAAQAASAPDRAAPEAALVDAANELYARHSPRISARLYQVCYELHVCHRGGFVQRRREALAAVGRMNPARLKLPDDPVGDAFREALRAYRASLAGPPQECSR